MPSKKEESIKILKDIKDNISFSYKIKKKTIDRNVSPVHIAPLSLVKL